MRPMIFENYNKKQNVLNFSLSGEKIVDIYYDVASPLILL